MTTTTAVAGPLIRFHDGTTVAYDVPRNTMDPRYSACHIHRPACDCREAHMNEDRGEFLAIQNEVKRTTNQVLQGHATWAFTNDGEWDFERRCQCTGCQIARIEGIRSMTDQENEGTPTRRPADWVAPR